MHHLGSKVVLSRLPVGYSITLFLDRFLTTITVFTTINIFLFLLLLFHLTYFITFFF